MDLRSNDGPGNFNVADPLARARARFQAALNLGHADIASEPGRLRPDVAAWFLDNPALALEFVGGGGNQGEATALGVGFPPDTVDTTTAAQKAVFGVLGPVSLALASFIANRIGPPLPIGFVTDFPPSDPFGSGNPAGPGAPGTGFGGEPGASAPGGEGQAP